MPSWFAKMLELTAYIPHPFNNSFLEAH
jgi:hypothetical protein